MENIIFACDIGGSKLLCGFVSADGRIFDTEKSPLTADETADSIEVKIMKLYQDLSKRTGVKPCACGMTIPGLADPQTGMWVYACFSGIAGYPIADRMKEKLGMHVYIENDVNACALAEKLYGACADCDDYLWVTVSNGVGGGLVIDGKIYSGAFGGAGEFGHIVVDENGLICPCGHVGCMEAMAAGPAISKRYAAMTGEMLPAKEIAQLAKRGDETALSVMKKTGEYIGKGLGKAASLLNLERYILGGGVMQAYDLMEADIKAAFAREAFERPNRKAKIVQTALKYEAGLLGAVAVAVTNM